MGLSDKVPFIFGGYMPYCGWSNDYWKARSLVHVVELSSPEDSAAPPHPPLSPHFRPQIKVPQQRPRLDLPRNTCRSMVQPKLIATLSVHVRGLQNSFRSISVRAERRTMTGELYKLSFVMDNGIARMST